jgi:hypothetical protein
MIDKKQTRMNITAYNHAWFHARDKQASDLKKTCHKDEELSGINMVN